MVLFCLLEFLNSIKLPSLGVLVVGLLLFSKGIIFILT